MRDLEAAKLRLKRGNLTLVIVKDGEVIFETSLHSIKGFLEAIEKLGEKIAGSFVADRIVGRAAAMLCAYSKVAYVFAVTMSEEGREVLKHHNIPYQYENLVPNILNYKAEDLCPLEKLTLNITNPEEAYEKLKLFLGT